MVYWHFRLFELVNTEFIEILIRFWITESESGIVEITAIIAVEIALEIDIEIALEIAIEITLKIATEVAIEIAIEIATVREAWSFTASKPTEATIRC